MQNLQGGKEGFTFFHPSVRLPFFSKTRTRCWSITVISRSLVSGLHGLSQSRSVVNFHNPERIDSCSTKHPNVQNTSKHTFFLFFFFEFGETWTNKVEVHMTPPRILGIQTRTGRAKCSASDSARNCAWKRNLLTRACTRPRHAVRDHRENTPAWSSTFWTCKWHKSFDSLNNDYTGTVRVRSLGSSVQLWYRLGL